MDDQASAATAPAPEATTPSPGEGTASPAPAADDTLLSAGSDPDADQSGADAEEAKKPPRGVQKRLDELTANWRAAERREQYLAEQNAALLALIRERGIAPPGQQPQAPAGQPGATPLPPELARVVGPEPKPEDFPAGEFDPGYIKAAALHEVRKEQAVAALRQQQIALRAEEARRAQEFARAVAEAEKRIPDLREAVSALGQRLPDAVANMIADAGPEVAYAIAKDPQAEARIRQARTPAAVAREIGRVEARLEAARSAPPPPKPTAAPSPPAQTARGGGAAARPLDPERMTAKEYYEARMRGDLP